MKSTDSEQEGVGMELEQYRNRLEQMVEEKSKDLIAIQENLEATNRRQALFIKVLQILQLEPDIPTAMNMALAEIGRYTGVDRLATWENHLDGVTYGCTYEWCNDGIEPAIDYLRSMTIEAGKLGSICSKKTISSVRLIFIHSIPLLLRCLKFRA